MVDAGRQGTCGYMAPEVLLDLPYNEKVDIYSFGVVMYEVFGRMLLLAKYDRSQLEAIQAKIANGFRPKRPQGFDPRVWNLVTQCWAQDPVERPTMEMVLRQLEDIADADGHSPGPSNTGASRVASGSLRGAPGSETHGRPASERSGGGAPHAPPSNGSGSLRQQSVAPGGGEPTSPKSRLARSQSQGRGGRGGVAGGPSRRGVMFHGQAEDEHGLEPPARVPGCGGCSCVIC
ncbi:MAG: hypothetical protein WDW36_004078 [Sanguina aurantia]